MDSSAITSLPRYLESGLELESAVVTAQRLNRYDCIRADTACVTKTAWSWKFMVQAISACMVSCKAGSSSCMMAALIHN